MKLKPELKFLLDDSEKESILNDAFKVLDKIGIGCNQKEAIKRLTSRSGITHNNGRLYFSPNTVRDHLESRRKAWKENSPKEEPPFSLGGCWAGMNYCNPETMEIKPATTEQATQMTKLWEARGVEGVIPVVPGDVNFRVQTLAAERICLLNSKKLGGSLTVINADEARFINEMYHVTGRRFKMFQQVFISPLRINDESFSVAMEMVDDKSIDVNLGGPIPMFGVTTPHNIHTSLAQSTAERLAYDLVACILTPRDKLINPSPSMIRLEPFDMQFGTIVFGSPEWTLLNMVVRQVQEYVTRIKCYGGSFRSTSKYPDAQAATERTACVLWQAMQGARSFGAVGQLSVDEIFSPQQAMFDYEILGYVERIIKGLDYDTDVDPLELIKEGLGSENYLTSELTSTQFKDFYYFPEIFKHWNVGNWFSKGSPNILDVAWEKARDLIKKADFTPTDAQVKEVNKIYKRAEEQLLGKK